MSRRGPAGPSPTLLWLASAALLLMVLVLAGLIWALSPSAESPTPKTDRVETARRLRTQVGVALKERNDALVVEVVDTTGAPAPGVTLSLEWFEFSPNGVQALKTGQTLTLTSDDEGLIREPLALGEYEVTPAGDWLPHRRSGLTVKPQTRRAAVVLQRICPGQVQVLDREGEPYLGKVTVGWRDGGNVYAPLDAGMATLNERACGESVLRIRPMGAPRALSTWRAPINVIANETVTVWEPVPPELRFATVLVVDEAGDLLHDAQISNFTALEPGVFQVGGFHDDWEGQVDRPGRHPQEFRVPLDDQEHELVWRPERRVRVELLCDDPPLILNCGGQEPTTSLGLPCTGGPVDFDCPCPQGPASVVGLYTDVIMDLPSVRQPLDLIPAGAEQWTIDARGQRAMVSGRWTGRLPCQARLDRAGHWVAGQECGPDGSFFFEHLLPGAYELRVGFPLLGHQTVGVVLNGEDLELGDIAL